MPKNSPLVGRGLRKPHTKTHTDRKNSRARDGSPARILIYFIFLPACKAFLKMFLARSMLSWLAWVYMRRVVALSVCPRTSDTRH